MYHFLLIKKDKKISRMSILLKLKILKLKILIKLQIKIPKKLKKNGNHFIQIGKNSASKKTIFLGKVNIEVCQKSVPNPIKKSLVKKPTNILPIAKIDKGKIIKIEDS